MKHFLGFTSAIFLFLTVFYFYKDDGQILKDRASLKVYGSNSFVGSWGPGPKLKELFEKQTGLKITYLEMTDPTLLLQKISFDGDKAIADVVLSLDQYDLIKIVDKIKWESTYPTEIENIPDYLSHITTLKQFSAYDWAPLAFIVRKDFSVSIKNLNDLLKPELKNRIALQDPRTSSPGLIFINWIYSQYSSPDEAEQFLKKLMNQAHSFSPSWSASYGLFKTQQVDVVLSYATSPLHQLIEEKNDQFTAIEFDNKHPLQVEFAGVPAVCKNCEGAKQFVKFLQSYEAQKIIMEKNYMFPIDRSAQEGTPFDHVKIFKILPHTVQSKENLQKQIDTWTELRNSEN